ncbi:hypothetical protein MAGR_63980 [Mycolicibacterium agri]|uniref:Uncharacterized protein n=1 Tax=Mycolicibacterium agri TaxID=36811 RepID=A0A7I9WCF7_MYCAG|nr:hypothetical protein MAGR_63980 [Mycolicibacterium agri]
MAVAAKSVLDHRFGVADFGVEGHHLLGQPRDHRRGDLLAGHGAVLGVGGCDRRGGNGSSVVGLAFAQPGFQACDSSATECIGSLVAGQQDQGGLAVAVIERPLQRREVFEELGAQPVDRAGAIGDQVDATRGQDPQIHRDLVARTQRLQIAAHAA